MKKITVAAAVFLFLLITVFIFATFYSFSTVKPTTEQVNKDLAAYFSKIIYIPNGIQPPIQGFSETIYFWEMETRDNEVIGVRLRHDTAFSKDQNTIRLTLEKEEKGDPSIFNKVLPSVIADQKSLKSAQDPQKADLSASPEAGYKSIKLTLDPKNSQTAQIIWEFEKSGLDDQLKGDYSRLDKVPQPFLKFLYSLPHFILSLFSA